MSSLDRDTAFDPSNVPFEPSGIAGTIEYNGLIFNDRRFADRIVVTNITGIDDPDVRDSRDQNPDRDGETAYDSFYSGRSIALRGYVKAGNLMKMKSLWGQLKNAFDDVSEHNLIFRWLDQKEFWAGNWAADYSFDIGAETEFTVGTGVLIATGATEKRLWFENRSYADSEVIYNFVSGTTFTASSRASTVFKHVSSSDYLMVNVTNTALQIVATNAGTPTTLATTAITTAAATSYWLRSRIEGNIATAEFWTSEPTDSGTPTASTSFTLLTTNATKFGAGISAPSGVRVLPTGTGWQISTVEFSALNAGDSMISCRKSAKIESDDSIDSNGDYRKDFLIPLRSASAPFVSHKLMNYTLPVTIASLIFPGGGGGFTFPADGSGLIFGASLGSVNNLGRSPAYPIIRLYGLATNPGLFNPQTGDILALDGTVASGDYIEFDSEHRTVVDSSGNSIYSELDTSTIWMNINPGTNILSFGADAIDASTKIVIYYRHSSR